MHIDLFWGGFFFLVNFLLHRALLLSALFCSSLHLCLCKSLFFRFLFWYLCVLWHRDQDDWHIIHKQKLNSKQVHLVHTLKSCKTGTWMILKRMSFPGNPWTQGPLVVPGPNIGKACYCSGCKCHHQCNVIKHFTEIVFRRHCCAACRACRLQLCLHPLRTACSYGNGTDVISSPLHTPSSSVSACLRTAGPYPLCVTGSITAADIWRG